MCVYVCVCEVGGGGGEEAKINNKNINTKTLKGTRDKST